MRRERVSIPNMSGSSMRQRQTGGLDHADDVVGFSCPLRGCFHGHGHEGDVTLHVIQSFQR